MSYPVTSTVLGPYRIQLDQVSLDDHLGQAEAFTGSPQDLNGVTVVPDTEPDAVIYITRVRDGHWITRSITTREGSWHRTERRPARVKYIKYGTGGQVLKPGKGGVPKGRH